MPGERTPDNSPGSSKGSSDDDISLREHMQRQLDTQARHFERVIGDLRDLLDERFKSQQQAVLELKTTTTDRFESVNEQRGQLNDQARTFMGRDESIARHERTTEAIAEMALRHENDMRASRERFEGEVKQLRDRHEADMSVVNSRLDRSQALGDGKQAQVVEGRANNAALYALIGVVVMLLLAIGPIIAIVVNKP